MIDRVTELMPGDYALGYKNLSNNEGFQFTLNPNMPGALQLEAMAQMLRITSQEGLGKHYTRT